MKENIFEVLIYLFENYLADDIELILDSEDIKTELVQAGFNNNEVNDAFYWLETLTEHITIKPAIPSAFRIFCCQEEEKTGCRMS